MWRNSRSAEEWERKKRYLIRSLFEDVSLLSPILEGYEPASPSSPSNFDRAASPLPELIIEVEPKKPNPHDEPEELYEELAKKMRRLYRKDFLGIDYSTSREDSINVSKTVIESIDCGAEEADKETEGSENIAKDTDASNEDSSSESSANDLHPSPEIMRQQQFSPSLGTPPRCISKSNSNISKTTHLGMEFDSKEHSVDVLETNLDAEITEHSGDGSFLLVTSTPTRKRTSARSSTEAGQKRRLESYSSSSSFESVANAATQTSFSDHEIDWSNFFRTLGKPTVYNVCSCSDHVCTT